MEMCLDLIFKYLVPILPIIISILTLKSGWTFTSEKKFNTRKGISEFSYEQYKKTDDAILKEISYEYGIAALTRDKNLNRFQREALLKTRDPVNNIDNYNKCTRFISITTNENIFTWSERRYGLWFYRRILEVVNIIIYFSSCFLVASPFIYVDLFTNTSAGELTLHKVGMVAFSIVCGIVFCLKSLHTLSTINIAEKLIKANR